MRLNFSLYFILIGDYCSNRKITNANTTFVPHFQSHAMRREKDDIANREKKKKKYCMNRQRTNEMMVYVFRIAESDTESHTIFWSTLQSQQHQSYDANVTIAHTQSAQHIHVHAHTNTHAYESASIHTHIHTTDLHIFREEANEADTTL